MTTGINTYTDIDDFVNTVWQDSALVLREQGPMLGLVTRFGDRGDMALRKNAEYGESNLRLIGETDDLTSTVFTPSVLSTLTPYEYGDQFFLTDQRLASDIFALRSDATQELGGAYGELVDEDLVGLFNDITGGTVGGTTTDLTWANINAAISRMRMLKVPRPWNIVLSPAQWHCLGTAIAPGATVTNSPALQDQFVRQFFMSNYAGVDLFVDGNIGTGATVYGAIFNPRAFAFDLRRAPRIEWERDASRRGYELNFTSIFAYGTWRPDQAISITSAGTTPVA